MSWDPCTQKARSPLQRAVASRAACCTPSSGSTGPTFAAQGFWKLIADLCTIVQPLILNEIINYLMYTPTSGNDAEASTLMCKPKTNRSVNSAGSSIVTTDGSCPIYPYESGFYMVFLLFVVMMGFLVGQNWF